MKRFAFILSILIVVVSSNIGNADTLIDTGDPGDGAVVLYENQYLYGEFTLNQPSVITDVLAYFRITSPNNGQYGDLTFALYGDAGDVPDHSNELYSDTIIISEPEGWFGLNNLALDFATGSYWIGLEARSGALSGQPYKANDHPDGVPNPLNNYAVMNRDSVSGPWSLHGVDVYQWAFRVDGIASPVPIPATIWFLGSGFIGLLGVRRFRDNPKLRTYM